MNVYIIFDGAGIWQAEDAVFARREDAQAVVDRENAKPHYKNYSLHVEEYPVREFAERQ